MIEWLMQVVAVAWLGAMVVMMLKVCETASLPRRRRRPDPVSPVRLPPRARAQRGNAGRFRTTAGLRRRAVRRG